MRFSQFRRAAVICSDMNDISHHDGIMLNLNLLIVDIQLKAKEKTMKIDRDGILKTKSKLQDNIVLTFVANYDPFFKKELNHSSRKMMLT